MIRIGLLLAIVILYYFIQWQLLTCAFLVVFVLSLIDNGKNVEEEDEGCDVNAAE